MGLFRGRPAFAAHQVILSGARCSVRRAALAYLPTTVEATSGPSLSPALHYSQNELLGVMSDNTRKRESSTVLLTWSVSLEIGASAEVLTTRKMPGSVASCS